MKSTFLFLVTTTMMTCTALGQPSNDKKNVLPDWAFGGFERPQGANPVISPIEDTKFYCPMMIASIPCPASSCISEMLIAEIFCFFA